MDSQTKTETSAFNKRFKEARENARYTFPALAKATGIPVKSLEKFEYGGMEPNITRLRALSDALNVSIAYLTTGEESNQTEIHEPILEIIDDTNTDDPIIQGLEKLDELRELGFETAWRTAPRFFEHVKTQLFELTIDDLLDIAEMRGLEFISNEAIEEIGEAEMEYHDKLVNEIIERILDTSYIGFDLYTLTTDELKDWARHLRISSSLSASRELRQNVPAFIAKLRHACREATMKGDLMALK